MMTIPRMPRNFGKAAPSDLQALTDYALLQAVAAADLRVMCDDEDNANGWSVDTAGDSIDRLRDEYARRYGQPLPSNRSASFALYHTPQGFRWNGDKQTLAKK